MWKSLNRSFVLLQQEIVPQSLLVIPADTFNRHHNAATNLRIDMKAYALFCWGIYLIALPT